MTTSAIERWLEWLSAGDLSQGTVANRRSYIRRFEKTVPDVLDVDEQALVSWLNNPAWGTETRRSATASVRSFYGWAIRTGAIAPKAGELVAVNPCDGLHRIKPKQRIPRPIGEHDLQAALALANREQEFMLLLGAYAGLRRSEIARVHADWVTDLGLIVMGKGGKQRRVPIHPRLVPHLRGLRGWAFPSPRKPGHHVYPTYIRDHLGRVLPQGWTPHNLRHRFATQAFRATKDIQAVQQLLGHAKIETTLLYVLVEQDALNAAVASIA